MNSREALETLKSFNEFKQDGISLELLAPISKDLAVLDILKNKPIDLYMFKMCIIRKLDYNKHCNTKQKLTDEEKALLIEWMEED